MKKLLLFIAFAFIATKSTSQVVAEYNFNNTMNNVLGNSPFATNSATNFTTDRFNVANSALFLGTTTTGGKGGGDVIQLPGSTTATIPNLPVGNQPRTVSIWINSSLNGTNNPIFSYGSSSANAAFGLGRYQRQVSSGGPKPTITTTTNLLLYGYANDLAWSEPTIPSGWNHFVVTYNGTAATIYMNGVVKASGTKAWNTANTVFRLGQDSSGSGFFYGAIDDLKIYDYVISEADIVSLYTNNTLGSHKFNTQNLNASIYPNPTSDNFTIEMENELKSIEIYSLQGQKVMTSTNKITNVSILSKGIYMVRIEDIDNAVHTQKLIIE